jgi:AbrB family looped-hinge helix DNA binding protein
MEWVSTISAKGRTTVPKPVRDALGVGPGGKIVFRVEEGRISIRRAAIGMRMIRSSACFFPFLPKTCKTILAG